ncbi:cytochrome b561 [Rhizobiales bacterium GAS188]|nr:cytochrome b561 [Rhizobiales bacterium GAS188]
MKRRTIRTRKTDYGTLILHWLLVGSFAIAAVTGLKIAAEDPGRSWINFLDGVLPRAAVWTTHIQAALVLVAVAVAYAIYVSLAGLASRIRLDRVRLVGLFGSSQVRWGAVNVILYWLFYVTLVCEFVTGGLLYFDYANSALLNIHWSGMWVILGYVLSHVLAHWRLGGVAQLLRIFRPAPLPPPPPRFDPMELLALLTDPPAQPTTTRQARELERDRSDDPEHAPRQAEAAGADASRDRLTSAQLPETPGQRPQAETAGEADRMRQRGVVLQANPFVVATAAALIGVACLVAVDREAVDTLHISRIEAAEAPRLDGDTSDPVWRKARSLRVMTVHGGNFDKEGETTVEIRAVHDGTSAYFLFIWEDPTRSLKQLPLMKQADGWHLLKQGYEVGDEHAYSEDKFSVLLTRSNAVLAGDRTFHAGTTPAAGKPGALSGRGLHYTLEDGALVDVWLWKATSSGTSGWMDDGYFGPPKEPTQEERDGTVPYRGGFAPDPGTANYSDNFEPRPPDRYREPVKPRRLPTDYKATVAALGKIDLDPNVGESDGARWYMTEAESTPYSEEVDAGIPVGTIIPGVIISGQFSGDRAAVRFAARWASGRWALKATRLLDTKSPFHVPIGNGTYMRVAAFDHSQIRHTRHVRPIRLEVE